MRDIPMVDDLISDLFPADGTLADIEEIKESLDPTTFDPSSAISWVTNTRWIPCHNVILYDLENNRIVDPFIDDALQPDVVIVTGATFAPDGKSLLCAVFGDGGIWYMADYEISTLYQIRLDDGSFDAMRIFKTYVPAVPDMLSWLENNSLLIRSFEGIRPRYTVQIVMPAAFERYADKQGFWR
jgi:hypothetical protein